MAALDNLLAAQPALSRSLGVVEDLAHQTGRLVQVGVGPHGSRGIRADVLAQRGERVRHEVARVRVHEGEVARVAGRDRRLPERHRLSDRETEAFAAMKRDVAVGKGAQGREAVPVHVAV